VNKLAVQRQSRLLLPELSELSQLFTGLLTIKALRTRTTESNGLSEFSYGSFTRTVSLPAGADEDDISATYDRGILTVSVPLSDTEPTEKHVEVFEVALDDDDIDDEDIYEDMYEDDDEDDKDHPSDEAVDQSEGEDQHRSDDGA
jgi:HSP20 family protein